MIAQLFLALLVLPFSGIRADAVVAPVPPFTLEQLRQHKNIVPVLVVGSGPTGLAAALHAVRAGLHTVVVKGHEPGGQLMGSTNVENILALDTAPGYQIMKLLEERVTPFGVQFLDDSVVSVERDEQGCFFVTTENGLSIYALSVVLATGASPRMLGVPGEERYNNNGLFTCAVCDCRQATDKDVIVVGGGDSSIEALMMLAPYARKLTLMVRGSELRAALPLQRALKKYKVELLYHSKIAAVIGGGDTLTGVQVMDSRSGETKFLPTDCVFLSIGHTPNSAFVASLVATDDHGYIMVDGRSQRTTCPGIFAAGDVIDPVYRLADPGMGDGAKAGFDVRLYLRQRQFSEQMSHDLEAFYFNA